MLFVVGKGLIYPEGRIENSHLQAAWQTDSVNDLGIVCRATSLPEPAIAGLRNYTGENAQAPADFTPSTLAAQAVLAACQNAGIGVESVGMIIGECATPEQTIPGISHRVGKRLGTKPYAFDLMKSFVSLPEMLATLLNYQSEQLPEYIACVSVNLFTRKISYRKPTLAAATFGDAASALILSPTKTSPVRVTAATSGTIALPPQKDRFAALEVSDNFITSVIEQETVTMDALKISTTKIGVLSTSGKYVNNGINGSSNIVAALDDCVSTGSYALVYGDAVVEVQHA